MREALNYLAALEANNNRAWYHAHKAEKAEADGEFAALIQELLFRSSEDEPELMWRRPEELIFRLPRDVRMWRDKPPYNPAYRASISPWGKRSIPVGGFISIQPGDRSFLAGGLHTASFREATLMVREHIFFHADEWMAILNAPDFSRHFTVQGEKLKNIPREYAPDAVCGEWLKHKSWYVYCPLSDQQVLSTDLAEYAAEMFRKMRPFNAFLNEALRDFKFPEWEQ